MFPHKHMELHKGEAHTEDQLHSTNSSLLNKLNKQTYKQILQQL